MYNRAYTPERISELKENEVFVFGSNLAGAHGGGAARFAYERFGDRCRVTFSSILSYTL